MAADRWTEEVLSAMHETADPLADALIAEVRREQGLGGLRRLNRFLQHWQAPVPDELPASLKEFLRRQVEYPDWVEMERLRRAQVLFLRWGMQTLMVLFLKSFAQFFAAAGSARVFARANLFNPDSIPRFVVEITQLIFDVVQQGGLEVAPRKGPGVEALQKLRLHHSIIRLQVTGTPVYGATETTAEPWDARWGEPINQEDLAAATLAFSVWTLQGTERLGIRLSDDDKETILMIWKVVGFLLGLDERLQPTNLTQAETLLERIGERRFHTSEPGRQLLRDLVRTVRGFLPWTFRSLPPFLMRFLMEPRFIRMLDVPQARLTRLWFFLVSLLTKANLERAVLDLMWPRFLHRIKATRIRHGRRGELRIPEKLVAAAFDP